MILLGRIPLYCYRYQPIYLLLHKCDLAGPGEAGICSCKYYWGAAVSDCQFEKRRLQSAEDTVCTYGSQTPVVELNVAIGQYAPSGQASMSGLQHDKENRHREDFFVRQYINNL